MASVIVIDRQNLLDLALQEYGNVQAVFDLAMANGLDITDELTPGQEITLPESQYTDKDVLNFYKTRDIRPVTAKPLIDLEHSLEGVSYWAIEDNFTIQ